MIRLRILLVEDETLIRLVASEILEEEGFEVVEASSGDEAVRLIDTSDCFDAIFTDVQIPGKLDGIGVAMHARQLNPTIPVVVVSGYAPQLMARLSNFEPSATFFCKPYAMETIVETLLHLNVPRQLCDQIKLPDDACSSAALQSHPQGAIRK